MVRIISIASLGIDLVDGSDIPLDGVGYYQDEKDPPRVKVPTKSIIKSQPKVKPVSLKRGKSS